MAHSVKRPTFDFSSGHDINVERQQSCQALRWVGSPLEILSLPLPLSLSLPLKRKIKNEKLY